MILSGNAHQVEPPALWNECSESHLQPFVVMPATYWSLVAVVSSAPVNVLIGIPVKPFGVAKQRLSPVLSAGDRSALGKAVAANTAREAARTGAGVAIVTGDTGVARWAHAIGIDVIWETAAAGLDGAARDVVAAAAAQDAAWMVLHADLPLIRAADLQAAIDLWEPGRRVIAPSYDGGTSLLMGSEPVEFSFGPGSFHRHLQAAGGAAAVVVRTGLALDLDTPRDFAAAKALGLPAAWDRAAV